MTTEDLIVYQESFKQHLAKSGERDSAKQDMWVQFVESDLADFVRSHYVGDFGSIYELTKADLFRAAMSDFSINDSLKEEYEDSWQMLARALQIYQAFLGSKWHPLRAKSKKALGKGETPHVSTPATPTTAKPVVKLVEGAILQERDREIHQRNPRLRQLCIEAYGNRYECVVCGMNFVSTYGEIGKEFIEVHHLYPISETDGEHEVNPATDMIPLCSNCHSMIHRLEDKSDWKKLKELYEQNG